MVKNNLDKYLMLDLKRFLIIMGSWLVFVILHNLFFAIFNIEEAVFFIIAVLLIPIYFFISFIYTILRKIYKRRFN